MARKPQLFVKLDAGMPESPKIEPLSDAAFRALIEAWCLCRRTGNDGQIPLTVWSRRWTAKVRNELVNAGLVVVGIGVVEIHDWLQWQPSVEELQSKSAARSQAGRAGGLKSGTVRQKRTKDEAIASSETKQLLPESSSKTDTNSSSKPRTNREQEEEEEEEKERGYVSGERHVASLPPSQTPTTPHCSQHPNGTSTPCGACAEARKAVEKTQADYAAAARAARQAETRRDADAKLQAIVNCTLCDDDGYLGHRLCDHVDRSKTASRGSAAVRAALAKKAGGDAA